jgi:hypothetical protein
MYIDSCDGCDMSIGPVGTVGENEMVDMDATELLAEAKEVPVDGEPAT